MAKMRRKTSSSAPMPRHPREPRRGRGIVTGEPGALKGARRVRRKAARKRPAPAIAGHGTSPRSPSGAGQGLPPPPGRGRRRRPQARRARPGRPRPGRAGPSPPPGGAAHGAAGFAGRVTLTVPLGTVTGRADRPGELGGIGPVDPWLARDLAAAAARNPKTTWCVTVTDQDGHAAGHGCARPEPSAHRQRAGPGPPGHTRFTFTPASRDGPPGGYGTWRLRTPGPGPDLLITLESLTTDPCDHRHQANGHDPGSRCGTWPRSGTPPAPAPSAGGPPPGATSSTTSPMRRAAGRACATGSEMPPRPPAQAAPEMEGRPTP